MTSSEMASTSSSESETEDTVLSLYTELYFGKSDTSPNGKMTKSFTNGNETEEDQFVKPDSTKFKAAIYNKNISFNKEINKPNPKQNDKTICAVSNFPVERSESNSSSNIEILNKSNSHQHLSTHRHETLQGNCKKIVTDKFIKLITPLSTHYIKHNDINLVENSKIGEENTITTKESVDSNNSKEICKSQKESKYLKDKGINNRPNIDSMQETPLIKNNQTSTPNKKDDLLINEEISFPDVNSKSKTLNKISCATSKPKVIQESSAIIISALNYDATEIDNDEELGIDESKLAVNQLVIQPSIHKKLEKRKHSDLEDEEDSRCNLTNKLKTRNNINTSIKNFVDFNQSISKTELNSDDSMDSAEISIVRPPKKEIEVLTVDSDSSESQDTIIQNVQTEKKNIKIEMPTNDSKFIGILSESDDSSNDAFECDEKVDLSINVSQEIKDFMHTPNTPLKIKPPKPTKSCAIYTKYRPLTKKKPSCPTYTPEMSSFYDSDVSDDLDIHDVLSNMSNNKSDWKVDSEDYMKPKRRRYFDNSKRCKRCREFGHVAQECSRPERCHLCSEIGHQNRYNCPNNMCFKCSGNPHVFCSRTAFNMTCHLCKRYGHQAKLCPDIWRRFHSTIEGDGLQAINDKKVKLKPERDAYCYNCAKKGHFGHNCRIRPSNNDYIFASPVVYNYHITLPMTTPLHIENNKKKVSDRLSFTNEQRKEVPSTDDDIIVLDDIDNKFSDPKEEIRKKLRNTWSTPVNLLPQIVDPLVRQLSSICDSSKQNPNLPKIRVITRLLVEDYQLMLNKKLHQEHLFNIKQRFKKLVLFVYGHMQLGNGQYHMKKIKDNLHLLKQMKRNDKVPQSMQIELNDAVNLFNSPAPEHMEDILELAISNLNMPDLAARMKKIRKIEKIEPKKRKRYNMFKGRNRFNQSRLVR